MGITDTRVQGKNGKLLTVLTQDVQRLHSRFEGFKEDMDKDD